MVDLTLPPDRTCPGCGQTAQDFLATKRAGCAQCYQVFCAALTDLLPSLHHGPVHAGQRPRRPAQPWPRINVPYAPALLAVALQEAVRAENYELAAALRDLQTAAAPPPSPVEVTHGSR